MYKLILTVILVTIKSLITQGQPLHHNYLFVNKNDTAYLNFYKKSDSVAFKITLKINRNKIAYSQVLNFTMIEQLNNKQAPFIFIAKDLNGKDYNITLHKALYFSKNKKSTNALYQKMVGERTAFILNGIISYRCLTAYKLQKNSYDGTIRMLYNPLFGPINLFINNMGEESTLPFFIAESFRLITVDGQKPEGYIKKFCSN